MGMGVATRRLAVGVLGVLSLAGAARAADGAPGLKIRILSSRPDMVSGGDALVEVRWRGQGRDAGAERQGCDGRPAGSIPPATACAAWSAS